MKKKLGGLIVVVALGAGGWLGAREYFADRNAGDYLSAKEIPTYHWMSFHTKDDLNLLGFCEPCGTKARKVFEAKLDKAAQDAKKDIESKLSGGRK